MSGFEILIITANDFSYGDAFTKVKVLLYEKIVESLLCHKGKARGKKAREGWIPKQGQKQIADLLDQFYFAVT